MPMPMDLKQIIFIQLKKSVPISGGLGGSNDPIVLHYTPTFPDDAVLEATLLDYLGGLFYFNYQIIGKTVIQREELWIERVDLACCCRFTFRYFGRSYFFDITERFAL
jgi:hypothetical protein